MQFAPGGQCNPPIVQALAALAERVLLALVRAGDATVQRDRDMTPELAHRASSSRRPLRPRVLIRNILKSMLHQRAEREPVDRVFHALADPNRRVTVHALSGGPATVSDLAQPLPMSLSAVVQHLQVLQGSGLVRSEKVGRVRTCRIEPAALRPVERWIGARRSSWERRLDRLGEYLAEGNEESKGGKA